MNEPRLLSSTDHRISADVREVEVSVIYFRELKNGLRTLALPGPWTIGQRIKLKDRGSDESVSGIVIELRVSRVPDCLDVTFMLDPMLASWSRLLAQVARPLSLLTAEALSTVRRVASSDKLPRPTFWSVTSTGGLFVEQRDEAGAIMLRVDMTGQATLSTYVGGILSTVEHL